MSEFIDEQADSPRSHSVSRHARLLPGAVALLSMLVFVIAAPFAKIPLQHLPAFIPAYESALILNDLITSVLLFGQCVIARSRALGALASGYLYTSAIALLHMLSFPGLFSATGLLNARPQSTAWIYMFWHAGLPNVSRGPCGAATIWCHCSRRDTPGARTVNDQSARCLAQSRTACANSLSAAGG